MKYSFLCLTLMLFSLISRAQEFQTEVSINVPNLQTADPKLFETMEDQVRQFMNSTQWTDVPYENEERIEMNLQINVTAELSDKDFRVDIYVQAVRPTYNSEYKTSIFNHADKGVVIEYIPFMQLRNSRNGFFDNLSSILSFYAYMVLGIDNDSFSPLGGDPYYQESKRIASAIPQRIIDVDPGWQSVSTTRSRFILMEDLLSPRMKNYRTSFYNYHRHGMDKMYDDPQAAIDVIVNSIQTIGAVNRNTPNAMLLQVFANTKRNEIVEILKAAGSEEKSAVYQVMSQIDPANISKYRLIRS